MKNFLVKFNVIVGEFVFNPKRVLKAEDVQAAEKAADGLAAKFYAHPCADNPPGEYCFHGGDARVSVESVREISTDEFNVLDKHLSN